MQSAPNVAAERPVHRDYAVRDVWIDLGAALLCILPFLLTAHLPLTDLPNHLARQVILRDWSHSAAFQRFYDIHWGLVPNLALELFVWPIDALLPIDLAMRLFCITTVLLLFLGTRWVNLILSKGVSRAYWLVPFLVYGGPLQFGFLSYCFGVGLGLVLFGAHLRSRGRFGTTASVAFFLASGFVLMLCHIAAFGLFALAVGGYELADALSASRGQRRNFARHAVRRLAIPVCCLTLAAALFMALGPREQTFEAVDAARFTVQFSNLRGKARTLFAITAFSSPLLEVGLLVLGAAGFAIALLTRTVRVDAHAALSILCMTLAWLVMPGVAFGGAFIDYRLPWAIAFYTLASLARGSGWAWLGRPFALYGGLLAVARIALISAFWLSWEPDLAALDQALGSVPDGTRLYVVEGTLPNGSVFRTPDLSNVASYVVARRQGFETGLFANVPGQVLYFKPHYMQLWKDADYAKDIPSRLDRVPADYDYVLVLLPSYAKLAPGLPLAQVGEGRLFTLYRVTNAG